MKKSISIILLILAIWQLVQLTTVVGLFNTIIYALCGAYIFNFIISLIVDTSYTAKRGTEQIKRNSGQTDDAD